MAAVQFPGGAVELDSFPEEPSGITTICRVPTDLVKVDDYVEEAREGCGRVRVECWECQYDGRLVEFTFVGDSLRIETDLRDPELSDADPKLAQKLADAQEDFLRAVLTYRLRGAQ